MAKQIPLENPLDCKYLKEWDNQTIDSLSSREASFEGGQYFKIDNLLYIV